ncbi:MAG TPA: DNRLRE domain-containing protein, partial [Candidatus Hydrogenedentes bacterium]|nr:DNRLRE domain-containing protein [Candidatus Hydrogenedentota bacterium]
MRQGSFSGLWAAVIAACLLGPLTHAATISPNDDVTTRGNSTNYDEYDFGNGAYAGLLVKTGDNYSWLEFTLGGGTVSGASLRLYNYWTQNGVNYDVRVKGATYSFNETTLTGANAPDTSAWTTVVDSFHVDTTAQWYTLDVTSFYNAHLGQTVTFKLEAVSGSGDGPIFVDREGTGGHTQYPYLDYATGSLPPIIAEVTPDPDSVQAGTQYVKQLTLTQGASPVTWSVTSGPSGLIVSSGGYVSGWVPVAGDVGQTFSITIQATNAYGSDTESWQVQVTGSAPLTPISPTDDVTTRGNSTNYDEYNLGSGAYAGLLVKPTNSFGWIEFPLGSTAADTATLHLYNYWTNNNVNYDVRVKGAAYNFNETTLTGSNAPDTSGWTTVVDSFHVDATAQWYTLDVTSFHNAHLGQTVTFKLEAVSGSGDGPIFVDREGTGGYTQYPYLGFSASNVPPVIAEVTPDPDSVSANTEYVKQLNLTQGTQPVTWSVTSGPTGLTVSSGGYVSGWVPGTGAIGQTFSISVQATNAYGSDTESWQVEVTTVAPPAPIYAADDVATRGDSTNYDEYNLGGGAYAGLLVKLTNSYSWIEFPLAGTSADTATLHLYNYWINNNVNYDVRVKGAAYDFNETT